MSPSDLAVQAPTASSNAEAVPFGQLSPNFAGIDTHAHVFKCDMKMIENRRYTPAYDATIADYLSMLDDNNLSHGVLVQISFLGTDNSYMVEALKQEPARLRGIAVVDPDITAQELHALDAAGVVGVRLNLIGLPDPDLANAEWQEHLRRLNGLGWQVEVQAEAWRLPRLMPPLLAAGLQVVIDHFGRPDDVLGIDDPGFRYLLAQGRTRCVWVKLSGEYRNNRAGQGERIAASAAAALLGEFGAERLLWGSDWPHTCFEQPGTTATARQALDRWIPSDADRRAVFVATPRALFGFAPATADP